MGFIDVSRAAKEPYAFSAVERLVLPEGFGVSREPAEAVFEGSLTRTDGVYVLEGVMNARVHAPCASCLKDTVHQVVCPTREVFTRTPRDVDDWPVEDDKIDLSPALRCVLMAALPGRLVCGDGCRGLCPVCGADLNEGSCGHTETAENN